jgi:ferritin-like metal-binding protein YciE
MSVKTVQDLFINELRDIYHAEKQILKVLPKMTKQATHPELKQALEQHVDETRGQVERIEQVFELLEVGKRAKRCEAMEGLIEEARGHMEDIEDKSVLDPAMIISQQKIEHYEIAGYGSLVALANQLGHKDAAKLLEQTLQEEKATDEKLNKIALTVANQDASAGGGKGKAA